MNSISWSQEQSQNAKQPAWGHLSDKGCRNLSYLVIAVIALVASIPFATSYLVVGHDTVFHLYRIVGIADGLSAGQFPVRMQYVQAYGLGYPVSICYGDLFLYFPALLYLLGVSATRAYAVFAIAVNFATAIIAFICFRRMFDSRSIALVACALWTLSPYRLMNMVVRGAVGEYLAMTFFPLIALGLFLMFTRNPAKQQQARYAWVWCGAGAACVVYSHILSTALVLLICIPAVIVGLIFKHDRRTLANIGMALLCALLLSAAFVVPFVDFMMTNDLKMSGNSLEADLDQFAVNLIEPAALFELFPPMEGRMYGLDAGIQENLPTNVGWAIFGGAVLWLGLLVCGVLASVSKQRRAAGMCLFVGSAVLLVAATSIVPWEILPTEGPFSALTKVAITIQYSFRLLGPASFMLILLTCMALNSLSEQHVSIARVASAALFSFSLIEGGVAATSALEDVRYTITDFNPRNEYVTAAFNGVMSGEYEPAKAKYVTLDMIPRGKDTGGIEGLIIGNDHGKGMVHFTCPNEPGAIELPFFYYSQYEAIPGRDFVGECTLSETDTGFVRLDVTANSSGTVYVQFVYPIIWNIALGVTYASVIALIAYGVWIHRKKRLQAP